MTLQTIADTSLSVDVDNSIVQLPTIKQQQQQQYQQPCTMTLMADTAVTIDSFSSMLTTLRVTRHVRTNEKRTPIVGSRDSIGQSDPYDQRRIVLLPNVKSRLASPRRYTTELLLQSHVHSVRPSADRRCAHLVRWLVLVRHRPAIPSPRGPTKRSWTSKATESRENGSKSRAIR